MVASAGNVDMPALTEGFVQMARGYNETNEFNTTLGAYDHGNGWGYVIKNGNVYTRYRSIMPCWDDPEVQRIKTDNAQILHARRATIGANDVRNTHPFKIHHLGREWYFFHNGHNADCFEPFEGMESETDSEMLFMYLLNRYDDRRPLASIQDAVGSLDDVPYESLCSFLLDERQLFAINSYRTRPKYYELNFQDTGDGIVVSSEALPQLGHEWEVLENGQIARVTIEPPTIEIS